MTIDELRSVTATLARIDERTQNTNNQVIEIKEHLERLNGTVAKTCDRVSNTEKDILGHSWQLKALAVVLSGWIIGATTVLLKHIGLS